jgi:hypothetical protein
MRPYLLLYPTWQAVRWRAWSCLQPCIHRATVQTFMRLRDATSAQRLFIQYLRDQLATS